MSATFRATGMLAAGLAAACLLAPVPAAQAGPYGATQCAGSRFGSNLGCTANDVRITNVTAVDAPASCVAGSFLTLNFNVTVNSGQPNRYDIGIFFSNDGKDPQLLPASGGASSCSVFVLPTDDPPFRNLDPGPYSGQLDTCGDVNGTMNAGGMGGVSQGSGVLPVTGVTVKCQSTTGAGGKLWVPFILSWDQQAGGSTTASAGRLCQDNTWPVPGTTSKCNTPTVSQATVTNISVLPKIEKSDGITTIARGQGTSYSVVITNNTGDVIGTSPSGATNAVFKDPAVSQLTGYGVSCSATSGGATCPASGDVTVAAMQGAGITIPQMPAGSSVTFTVTATVVNDPVTIPDGSTITNTATVTVGGNTNSASDTNTVGSTALNHYQLSLSASSVACEPSTVTVTACASAAGANPCTNIYTGGDVNGQAATLATTAGSLGSTGPTFTTGVATTTLSHTAATNGTEVTVSLNGVPVAAPNPHRCCRDGSCATGNSCLTTFLRNALFIADTSGGGQANIPHQTAGKLSGQFYLRAVSTKADGTCDAALKSSASVDFGYECKNPATCHAADMMKIDTGPVTTIARNNDSNVTSYTPVTLSFSGTGYAPFKLNYEDVGLVVLHTRYTTGSLSGASNAFVVKPDNFAFPDTPNPFTCTGSACAVANGGSNPGAANHTGAAFVKAGSPFSVTVKALAAGGATTPSFGRELPAETVKLTPTLVSPSGGFYPAGFTAPPTDLLPGDNGLAGNFSFTNGVGTGNFTWNEVGVINLLPSVGDGNYLAAGDVIGQARSGNIGRFVPHHFNVTRTSGCPLGADANLFTYSGQRFTATATAVALNNSTTRNYHAGFDYSRDATLSNAGVAANFSNNAFVAGNFSQGVQTRADVIYTFPNKETEPLLLALRLAENTSVSPSGDGVDSVDGTEQQTQIRSGRLRLFNVHGSELLSLTMPVWVEYYATVNDGWVKNADDTCTTTALANLDLENKVDNPAQGTATITTKSPKTTTVSLSIPPLANGVGSLLFSAPGENGYGYADARMDLTSQSWLKYYWKGGGEADPACTASCLDPTGTATFGTYRGNPRHIHLRELY